MICSEGQPFGANYNPLYNGQGLKGHTGQDWSCGFGTPITSLYSGIAYKVWTAENTPDPAGYTCVCILVDNGIEIFEWEVGHLNPSITQGSVVNVGDVIGTEANNGPVYAGNIPISVAMQKSGDQRGHHRHYQKRPFQYSLTDNDSSRYLLDPKSGLYDGPKGYCKVFNGTNGYNGCVDPSLPVFQRDLFIGCSGYDVYVLQRFLVSKGLFTVEPTAFYG